MIKRVSVLLLVLVLSSFVLAVSSETSAEFTVGVSRGAVDDGYVPSVTFWDSYGGYIIGLIIVLIVIVVFNKKSKVSKKKVKRKVKKRK